MTTSEDILKNATFRCSEKDLDKRLLALIDRFRPDGGSRKISPFG
jgi:hypothetical protein